jgi:group II intron reverse transcriptase/maturase
MMNEDGKSDGPVVPTKPPNNAPRGAAEVVEERSPTKGNVDQQTMSRTQSRNEDMQRALDRVREAARRDKKMRFTTLFHHVTLDRLRASFLSLRRKAAAGVDGVTWEQYEHDLEDNLRDLLDRLHRGAYRAKPSRRVFIPKADGGQRPLGIASLEDKLVQRAVVEVMNAVYEEDFLGFSYGFRPGRSQHDALDALSVGLHRKVSWVLDADIRGFFDAIDHGWLERFVAHRIADVRMQRLVAKWLRAGVLVDGEKAVQEKGSPQGATVSPLLANIYLHYVFDLWVEQWRRRHANGEVIVVRYADDIIVGFQEEADARRFQDELRARLAQFGLELHPDKTRLLEFGRFAAENRKRRGVGKPETFDFLGFTHMCSRTKNGRFEVDRRTSKKRMAASLKAVRHMAKAMRHTPVPVQGKRLNAFLRGYFGYYAVPTNRRRLAAFRTQVIRAWRQALRRRGQRHRMTWVRMANLVRRWIPPVRIVHPWPLHRFAAKTQGGSPVR